MQARLERSAHQLLLLDGYARQHRSAPTPEEALLWRAINRKQLGVVFRRQVVLGRYIADFYAASAKLAIEVDGGYHARRRAADRRRDEWLARRGVRVVRVDAAVVRSDIEAAVARVREAIGR